MKRPFYLALIDRKRAPRTGTYSIDHNAIMDAKQLVKSLHQPVLVMSKGVIIREILPKTPLEMLKEEIASTERKLARLKMELETARTNSAR